MESTTAMDADSSSKEGRSHRSRVMEHALQSLGQKVKAASADGDGVRARQLLSQLQVRAVKRTRSIKRSSSCKKLTSTADSSVGSTWRRPATPPPRLLMQLETVYTSSSEESAAPTPLVDLRVDIEELGRPTLAAEKEMDWRGDRRRLAKEEYVSFFLKRIFLLLFFFFFCYSVFLVSK